MNEDAWVRWVMQSARTWDDLSFLVKRTGIEMVDSDHRHLTEFALEINRFVDTVENEQVDLSYISQQGELLEELYRYAELHFTREEALIERCGLGGVAMHHEQHQRILDMLRGTINDYQAGRLTITANLKLAVLEWVVVHINHVDFECLKLEKWRPMLQQARVWDDLSVVVQRTLIEPIDGEHRRLTEMFLRAGQTMREAASGTIARVDIGGLFGQLHDTAEEHFAHEQEFQARFRLPGMELQDQQHQQFLNLVRGYERRLGSEGLGLRTEVELALMEWWINHINEVDYNTLSMERWGPQVMENSRTWEEIAWVVRPTGVAVVDNDHRELVALSLELNGLLARTEKDRTRPLQDALDLFDRLHQLAADHFRREEAIMGAWHEPGFQEHCAEHQRLLEVIETYRHHLASNRLSLTGALKVKMLDWWINHTNGTDWRDFRAHADRVAATQTRAGRP